MWREEDFFCQVRRNLNVEKGRLPPFPFFSFLPIPPFSSLDRCLAKKGRRGRGEGVKQTRSSPTLSFPRKNSHQKNAFSFFFPPLFPGKWGEGKEWGKRRAKRLLLGKKEEGRKAFPIEVAFYANVLPFLPSFSPQKKWGKGRSEHERKNLCKTRLARSPSEKKRMEKDPIKSPWEKGMNIRSDKTLFRISPKPNW